MKSLLRSIPFLALVALVGLSCTTTNITNVTNPAITPTITRVSPDTAWTFTELTIHGTNFGYDAANVRVMIDTTRATVVQADDTLLQVIVPESARSGFIRVRTYEQTATSAKPVTIRYTFYPHPFLDSIPEGASFSITGSGMNNYHGALRISVGGVVLPIDSMFSDRIVSHVLPGSYSGSLLVSDADTSIYAGTLYVTIPSAWTTLSQIWDRASARMYHQRTGYINGPSHTIDSTWQDTMTFDRQIDTNIAGGYLVKTSAGVDYAIPSSVSYKPFIQVAWDIPGKNVYVTYYRHSVTQLGPYHSVDTVWSGSQSMTTSNAIGADIEIPLSSISCNITETTSDSTGSVNLRQVTSLSNLFSGSVDLILKR